MKLVIGNKNYSSWSLRAWLLLAAYDINFEEIRVPLSKPETKSELQKYSAAARVPVLLDDETCVWDSLAICEYISEQYLDGRGWPTDPLTRAEARSCCAEMHSGFFLLREKMPMNCRARNLVVEISTELQKGIQRIDTMWTGLRERYNASGSYLFGEFSIADCMFAPVVFRFNSYNANVSARSKTYMETLLKHEKVAAWLQAARAEKEIIGIEEKGDIREQSHD